MPNNQGVAILQTGAEFTVPSDCYVRIEKFSILEDYPALAGQRCSVVAHVESLTSDGRTVTVDIALTSFIIGRDYEQSADLLISPADKAVLTVYGAHVQIQVLYTQFPE